jgi:hypothetical protein
MKKLILLLLFVPIVSFGQEIPKKIKRGTAYILPMGNGIYQSSITGKSGFVGTGKLKTKALIKGQEFAKAKNATLEVISFDTVEQSFMVFPQAILTFRLVYNSIEINNPNDPNSVTISTTGNVLNNNQQTVITKPSSTINQKDVAIKELKKLKELLDLELITKEEFDERSKELKKIILDN